MAGKKDDDRKDKRGDNTHKNEAHKASGAKDKGDNNRKSETKDR